MEALNPGVVNSCLEVWTNESWAVTAPLCIGGWGNGVDKEDGAILFLGNGVDREDDAILFWGNGVVMEDAANNGGRLAENGVDMEAGLETGGLMEVDITGTDPNMFNDYSYYFHS